MDVEFSDSNQAFLNSPEFQTVKAFIHEHLLNRIEELGAEFGRWSRSTIA
ncbi:MAG TPA: pilus assembly protein CpaF, partial [Comamonadaceae bacterium]|nr:pilus assembly protein CpaF [Comamonadaceae bacterium]